MTIEKVKYFESLEEALKFVKINNIENYKFYTPDYTYRGVELAYWY